MSRNVPQIFLALIFSCGWYFLGSLLIRFSFHSLIYSFFDVAVYGFTGSSGSSLDFFSSSFRKSNYYTIIIVFYIFLHGFLLCFTDFTFFRHGCTFFLINDKGSGQIWIDLFHLI